MIKIRIKKQITNNFFSIFDIFSNLIRLLSFPYFFFQVIFIFDFFIIFVIRFEYVISYMALKIDSDVQDTADLFETKDIVELKSVHKHNTAKFE